LSTGFYVVFWSKIAGEFVVKSWRIAGKCVVAKSSEVDVDYLGLELSDFPEFSGLEPEVRDLKKCCG
jgi:hypothetical protein